VAYRVDLKALQSHGELNYARLCRLMPEQSQKSIDVKWVYHLSSALGVYATLRIDEYESSTYTSFVKLEVTFQKSFCKSELLSGLSEFEDLNFDLRLYHDANVLDIIRIKDIKCALASYPYPNHKMHQRDEKYQQQCLLSQCLSLCLKDGMSTKPPWCSQTLDS